MHTRFKRAGPSHQIKSKLPQFRLNITVALHKLCKYSFLFPSEGRVMLASTSTSYKAFLEAKLPLSRHSGLAVPAEAIHPMLKPHQRDIVRWRCTADAGPSLPPLAWANLLCSLSAYARLHGMKNRRARSLPWAQPKNSALATGQCHEH